METSHQIFCEYYLGRADFQQIIHLVFNTMELQLSRNTTKNIIIFIIIIKRLFPLLTWVVWFDSNWLGWGHTKIHNLFCLGVSSFRPFLVIPTPLQRVLGAFYMVPSPMFLLHCTNTNNNAFYMTLWFLRYQFYWQQCTSHPRLLSSPL